LIISQANNIVYSRTNNKWTGIEVLVAY